jgi:hypothetical protein
LSKLPQSRHPERSASPIYRVIQPLVARSRRTSAVLVLPMLLGAFRLLKPDNRICCDTHLMVTGIVFMHCNHLPSQVCSKSLNSGLIVRMRLPGKTVAGPPGVGSVVEKLRTAWVRQAQPGSFDSAPPKAVSRDKSVRRSAQDDDFVGVLTKKHPKRVGSYGTCPGLAAPNREWSILKVRVSGNDARPNQGWLESRRMQ